VKLGVNAAAHKTGVSATALRFWADIVLTQDTLSEPKTAGAPGGYPYLHMLKDTNREGAGNYSAEFKRKVVTDPGSTATVSKKFNVYKSLVQSWRFLAANGRYHGTVQAAQQPTQYGLVELSPLAQRVSDLEKENETLKARLSFFEKFKRELQKL
jgi:transposase-like protein